MWKFIAFNCYHGAPIEQLAVKKWQLSSLLHIQPSGLLRTESRMLSKKGAPITGGGSTCDVIKTT